MPRSDRLLPFVAAIVGVALFSVMDALMKRASTAGDVYNALLFRNVIGAVLTLPLWLLTGGRWPSWRVLKVHALRSAVVAGMAWLFFFGLVRIPMAEGIALSFIAPLIAIYLAAVTLGEKVQRRAVGASVLGLAGVVVIAGARLGEGSYDADALAGVAAVLASAVLYAANLVLQRHQAQMASPQEIALFQNLGVAAILALLAPWLAHWPAGPVLFDVVQAAILATLALMLLAWAYAREEAQTLVPTEYTAFVWAALMGWLWFGERVSAATVAGVLLIVAACWIAARKRTEVTAV